MQIVELPQQGTRCEPVARLGRAAQRPADSAWQVQKLRTLAGQLRFQTRFLEQHVAAGSATPGMAHSVRVAVWRIEQRLEELASELGDQHVELSDLTDLLDVVLEQNTAQTAVRDGFVGGWSA